MREYDGTWQAEHEEISRIEDFWEWHVAMNAFWDRFYAEE